VGGLKNADPWSFIAAWDTFEELTDHPIWAERGGAPIAREIPLKPFKKPALKITVVIDRFGADPSQIRNL
jgi:hypothetical protein